MAFLVFQSPTAVVTLWGSYMNSKRTQVTPQGAHSRHTQPFSRTLWLRSGTTALAGNAEFGLSGSGSSSAKQCLEKWILGLAEMPTIPSSRALRFCCVGFAAF